MSRWNLADVVEAVAGTPRPRRRRHRAIAPSPGPRSIAAPRRGGALLERGVERQDKVAQYLYNCPEYLESMFGRVQGRRWCRSTPTTATPTTSSSTCGTTPTRSRSCSTAPSPSASRASATGCRSVQTWLWVDDGSGPCPDWAEPYEAAAASADGRAGAVPPWGRDGDDLLLLYTGGTTGMPKGVMWRQDDLLRTSNRAATAASTSRRRPAATALREQACSEAGPRACCRPAPLMHGTGRSSACIDAARRRLRRARSRAGTSTRRAARHHRARRGQRDRHRRRRLRQADARRRSTPTPGGGTSRALRHHARRA